MEEIEMENAPDRKIPEDSNKQRDRAIKATNEALLALSDEMRAIQDGANSDV